LQIDDAIINLTGMFHPRHLAQKLRELADAFPVVVVSGARQVGKTTLVRHVFPRWQYIVFDPVRDVAGASADPDLFLGTHETPLVLDEIQLAPALVPAIKRWVDGRPGETGLYVLTGSQQWQVLRNVAESLAGRAAFLDLEGFSLAEQARRARAPRWLASWLQNPRAFARQKHRRVPSRHSVYELLWRGCLPRATMIAQRLVPDFWDGYQRTYVERDARLLADLSDWQQFGRFLRLVCALTSGEINHSQLGREIGITPQTAERWLRILQGTYQWYELPAFGRNMIKRVSAKPKGYVSDTGLACRALQVSSPSALAGHPAFGALFETFVACELRKLAALLPGASAFHHWRAAGGAEVDIVIERDGRHFPVEIKATTAPARRDTDSLHSFLDSYPRTAAPLGLVIAPIPEPHWLSDRVYAIPWDLDS
jgi:uncharacterized protein